MYVAGVLPLTDEIFEPNKILPEVKALYQRKHKLYKLPWGSFKICDSYGVRHCFQLPKGEITCLLGHPSSGKTSFLDTIVTHTISNDKLKWAIFSPESGMPAIAIEG